METIAPSALMVAILYFLSRWALATVDYAERHPGKGRPDVTWRITWTLAIAVSLLSTASVHVWLLTKATPTWEVFIFNALVFGGFSLGFLVSGLYDHKVRLGLADKR